MLVKQLLVLRHMHQALTTSPFLVLNGQTLYHLQGGHYRS